MVLDTLLWSLSGKQILIFITNFMKEIILTNFATCFPDQVSVDPLTGIANKFLFTPYVSAYELEGQMRKEFYWKCNTCGDRANQTTRESAIPEVVLRCKCRDNYSYGLDVATDMATAVEQIPLSDLI